MIAFTEAAPRVLRMRNYGCHFDNASRSPIGTVSARNYRFRFVTAIPRQRCLIAIMVGCASNLHPHFQYLQFSRPPRPESLPNINVSSSCKGTRAAVGGVSV
jgi:hypothetical protein